MPDVNIWLFILVLQEVDIADLDGEIIYNSQ